jgi:hypothetical protein
LGAFNLGLSLGSFRRLGDGLLRGYRRLGEVIDNVRFLNAIRKDEITA